MNWKIHNQILDKILYCEYKPGQILNEQALADEFKVSRTPMREVLNMLEWKNLVRIMPRSGTIVTEIDFPKIRNVYQIRFEIENMAGKLAAEQISTKHLEKIKGIINECTEIVQQRDQKKLIMIDIQFREVLYEAANNPILKIISDYLYHMTIRLTYTLFNKSNWCDRVKDSLTEYQEIHDALLEKNAETVGRLRKKWLKSHIDSITKII